MTSAQRTEITKYQRIWNLFKLLLAFSLIGLILSKTNFHQIILVLENIAFSFLGIVFLIFVLHTGLKTLQYWALFDRELNYWQIFRIVVYQNALAKLVSNAAGVVSYLAMFRVQQNVTLKRSGTIFVLTKIVDLFSMGLFTLISAYFVWERILVLRELVLFLFAGLIGGWLVLWAAVIFRKTFVQRVSVFLHWIRLDRLSPVKKAVGYLEILAGHERKYIQQKLALAMLLSLLYFSVGMLYYYLRVKMVQIPIDLWAVIFVISLNQFISLLPLQILGGLGTVDITSLYLYRLLGVTDVDLPASLLGLRILTYLFHLVFLLLLYLPDLWRRLLGQVKKV
jgi:uncharacterized membrane protein YbhN (UPF0104 family)